MNMLQFNELHPTSIVKGNSTAFTTTAFNYNIVPEDLVVA